MTGESPATGDALPLGTASRVTMMVTGYIPIVLVLSAAGIVLALRGRLASWPLAVIFLYALPPLASRLTRAAWPLPQGRVAAGGPGFLAWWLQGQWEMIFNRVAALEEALRLVPGLYSLWLRLWGARIGAFVYWSPCVHVFDRSQLEVGDRVVFGIGAHVHGHLVLPAGGETASVIVAPVRIGARSLVGAYARLAPGVQVAEGEATPPLRTLGPYTEWRNGRRQLGGRSIPLDRNERRSPWPTPRA